ncbi:MAG: alpha/beta hydrolase, partial [Ginsengibacter sp.]
ITYTISGEGHPVLLIHGFGEDGRIWEKIINTLNSDNKIIVVDLPGSSKSTLLHSDNKTIGIEDYAEVIRAILEQENIEKITVIGHSMGGYIALAFAELYPAMLSGLGLFHSTCFADDDKKKETRLKGINFVKDNGALAFLKTSVPPMFAEDFQKESSTVVEDLVDNGRDFTDDAVIQYYTAMMNRKDRSDVLLNITVPVLFIVGEKDQAVPLEQSLKQLHLPARSLIKILPDAAHMGMLEEPGVCIGAIQQFLNIRTETMKVN